MVKVRNLRRMAAGRDESGSPKIRFAFIMHELEKRFPDPEPFGATVPELRYLNSLDEALAKKDAALNAAITALNDWSRTHAPEHYEEHYVEETQNRLKEVGTLYYIADVLQQCNIALKETK